MNRPPRGASGNVQPIPQVAPPAPASVSLPIPQRRWGLVIGVLVIDLGLAAAGVWMLSQGLASSEPTSTTTGSGSAAVQTGVIEGTVPRPRAAAALRDAPPPTTPTVTPIEAGTFVSPPPAAAIAPSPSTAATEPPTTTATTDLDPPAPPPADVTPAASPPPRAVRKKQRTNRHPASAPLDPYTE